MQMVQESGTDSDYTAELYQLGSCLFRGIQFIYRQWYGKHRSAEYGNYHNTDQIPGQ